MANRHEPLTPPAHITRQIVSIPAENFDDRDPGFPEPLPKGRAYRVVRAADDEVHDLDGHEDDP